MYLIIYEGIEKRRLLEIYCHEYFRVVEPHLYGRDRGGHDVLRAYQVAGSDEISRHVGWESFEIAAIEHIGPLSTHFAGPRRSFHPEHLAMQQVYCQLRPGLPLRIVSR